MMRDAAEKAIECACKMVQVTLGFDESEFGAYARTSFVTA